MEGSFVYIGTKAYRTAVMTVHTTMSEGPAGFFVLKADLELSSVDQSFLSRLWSNDRPEDPKKEIQLHQSAVSEPLAIVC